MCQSKWPHIRHSHEYAGTMHQYQGRTLRLRGATVFLRVAVLLIPNFLVFCANFLSKLNSSPRLRGATGFLRFFSVSQCLRGGFWFLLVAPLTLCFKLVSSRPLTGLDLATGLNKSEQIEKHWNCPRSE